HRISHLVLALDRDSAKSHRAGVGLQSDESRGQVAAGRHTALSGGVGEGSGSEAVEKDGVRIAGNLNLVVVPLAGLKRRASGIGLLASGRPDVDRVDGPCPVLVRLVGLGLLIDLDLEPGGHGHPSWIAGDPGITQSRWCWRPWVPESDEDAGVVGAGVETELKPEREV